MPVIQIRNYLCSLPLLLAIGSTVTAEEADEAIARCARIATVGDRILCLETALRQSPGTGVQIEKPAVAEMPEVDDEVLSAVPGSVPVDSIPAPTADTPAVIPDAAPPAADAAAASIPAAVSKPSDFGTEQVEVREGHDDEDDEPARIDANIINHELVLTGRLRLTLDNGQVWQQTTDDDRNIARFLRGKNSVPVEMWQGRSGGYRMYLVPFERTLRVKRLK